MAKQIQELVLAGISLDHSSTMPMYRQLYEALREAILRGQLAPGQRLPATRRLAEQLGISRNTVLLAFEYLWAEGYLNGKTGSGTFVTETLPEKLLHAVRPIESKKTRKDRQVLSERGQIFANLRVRYSEPIRPFRHGWPDLREFPFSTWNRILSRQLRTLPYPTYGYGDPAGYLPLRRALASYLRTARAVRCQPDQIIIVNGSQQALDLSVRILLDQGDTTWVEDPGYIGAKWASLGAGIKVVPVPTDDEGIDIERGKMLAPNAGMVHVTPSHQFPLGVTMSLSRRLQLLEWANEADAWVLEDDYDSEYRYAGRPLSSLQGLDVNNRVIYIGTFSKVLFPALRLGYLVAPPDLVDAFVSAKALSDRGSAVLQQAVLADFIEEGHFGRHIRRMRLLYQERQAILLESIRKHFSDFFNMAPSEKGMHEIAWFVNKHDDRAIVAKLAKAQISAVALSSFSLKRKLKPGLVLGYAAFNEKEIKESIAKMAATLMP